ncbi:MAG: Tripartite tricarboxylate transporter TctB family [uncultured Microvirga sp.]|uniref:Tripartite tricarboxylate transporter TctB family n=1 Tax=uncultured Microvirga sp. TaxID=412392 RepID=A0A6J4MRN2_9HYPH|nr:MAG: Tripartite tricarboxylate transporter TctB family [uncultured Microvirga sp.]
MHLSDRITGPFLVGLGAFAAYGGSRLPPVPGQQIGPNVFPMVIGVGLMLCGAMVALGIGRVFEEEAEADLAAHENPPAATEAQHGPLFGLRALIPPGLLLFYATAVERLGFVPTAAIIALITAKALGASWRLALPIAALAPVGVHLVFYKLLRVALPPGLLPMPW